MPLPIPNYCLVCYQSILSSPLPLPLPLLLLTTRHYRGRSVASLLSSLTFVVIVTAVTTIFPPLFCDLFDCCICSVIVSSPLPHPVAIPPTASTIVVIVIVIVVMAVIVIVLSSLSLSSASPTIPPLRLIYLMLCACPHPLSCCLPVAPPPLHFPSFVDC